jgi:hypothetical protein
MNADRSEALDELVAHAERHGMYEATGGKPPLSSWRLHQWQADHGFVRCDADCGALADPVSSQECRAALEHWRDHGVTGGCSHGR